MCSLFRMEGKGVEIEVAVPGKNISISDVTIEVAPACHPAPGAKDAVGYIIKSGGHAIYFAGDTLLNQEVTDAVKKVSPDIMFVPVGNFKILWKKVVMDASDAAQMAVDVGPKVFVPMHYGFLKKGVKMDRFRQEFNF